MEAEQALREGDLEAALAALQDRVRRNPSDAKLRVFLFQLLCLMGQWARALTQLKVVAEIDASTLAMVHTYGAAVEAEPYRAEVFSGRKAPMILGKPTEWMALMIQALRAEVEQGTAAAQSLRHRAFDVASAVAGEINDAPFQWIADADARLGPMLEAIINGRYYWVPFERIRRMDIEAPSDLRDLIWAPAHFEWSNGGEVFGLIPVRYPGSEADEDATIRMARRTEWTESGAAAGRGQRLLATDVDEYPFLEVRSLNLDAPQEVADADKVSSDG